LNEETIPDDTTILKFRRFLEQHGLAAKILYAIYVHLSDKGLLLRQGTIVNATTIQAPSSTKNANKQRSPDVRDVVQAAAEQPVANDSNGSKAAPSNSSGNLGQNAFLNDLSGSMQAALAVCADSRKDRVPKQRSTSAGLPKRAIH
jgi:IS5 family transposase